MEKLIAGQYDLGTKEGTLHYDIYGHGPACIVLSGGPGLDSRYFGNLGGIEDTVMFVLLHPRGSGLSQHPDESDWSLSAYARDVEAVRSHLGLQRPLVLGHSHGGFIALQYALDYPQASGGLILVGTSSCMAIWDAEAAVRPYADEPWFPEAHEAMKSEPTNEEDARADLLAMMPFYFAHTGPGLEAVKERIALYRMNIAPKFDFATYDLRASLSTIQAPTLILAGRQDWICTAQMSEEMARLIPAAQLVVFDECGHFPWMEAHDGFRSAIHDFVGGLALPTYQPVT
jgi:proline-specific peptidase